MDLFLIMKIVIRRIKHRLYFNLYKRLKRKWTKELPLKDVHVYSYPKSGRTWLRIMLDGLNDTGLTIAYVHGDAVPIKLKHYKAMTFDLDKFRDRKIIFLLRDPRDTVVSAYYDAVYRDRIYNGTISEFIRHNKFGIKKVLAFHLLCKESLSELSDHMILKYEELQSDTIPELERTLTFLGAKPSKQKLKEVVTLGKFNNMKKMEVAGEFTGKYAYSLSRVVKNNPNSGKVRKGKVGGYLEELSAEDVYYCNDVMRTEKNHFYPI
jgi:hypothetical protein